ncbi:hypothetical protein TWF730_005887 [Orbilia blumenaviensis]|uniref:Myb-like domain-containing protein n=1 Tax=Orbilia blumenaviensis TaxID=1796055 RepID=A0AAV9VMH7_9PEZI
MPLKRELSPSLPSLLDENPSANESGFVKEECGMEISDLPMKKRKTKAAPNSKGNKTGKGDNQIKKGTWTEEQDCSLHALITKDQGGNEVKASWNEIYEGFSKLFPGNGKTLNSLQMRWKVKIRAGDTDLSLAEKMLFKQAVANIDGTERALAYAWRFKELGGRDLNKSAVIKLCKMLKAKQLELEDAGLN